MKALARRLAPWGSLALVACAATAPPEPAAPQADLAAVQRAALIGALPGHYSNYAQARAADDGRAVLDVEVRYLTDGARDAFVFERTTRATGETQALVYLLAPTASPDVVEFRFAPVREAGGERSAAEVLDEAQGRVRPGCVLPLTPTPDGLVGETNPATCRFEHPDLGTVGLLREVSVGRGTLTVAERLLRPDGGAAAPDSVLALRRHAVYRGWAGVREDASAAPGDPAAWRLALPFTLRDDGRVVPLADRAGEATGYALRLSVVGWRSDEPPILRLAVLDAAGERELGFAWGEPGAERIGISLERFQAGLERATGRSRANEGQVPD